MVTRSTQKYGAQCTKINGAFLSRSSAFHRWDEHWREWQKHPHIDRNSHRKFRSEHHFHRQHIVCRCQRLPPYPMPHVKFVRHVYIKLCARLFSYAQFGKSHYFRIRFLVLTFDWEIEDVKEFEKHVFYFSFQIGLFSLDVNLVSMQFSLAVVSSEMGFIFEFFLITFHFLLCSRMLPILPIKILAKNNVSSTKTSLASSTVFQLQTILKAIFFLRSSMTMTYYINL